MRVRVGVGVGVRVRVRVRVRVDLPTEAGAHRVIVVAPAEHAPGEG